MTFVCSVCVASSPGHSRFFNVARTQNGDEAMCVCMCVCVCGGGGGEIISSAYIKMILDIIL